MEGFVKQTLSFVFLVVLLQSLACQCRPDKGSRGIVDDALNSLAGVISPDRTKPLHEVPTEDPGQPPPLTSRPGTTNHGGLFNQVVAAISGLNSWTLDSAGLNRDPHIILPTLALAKLTLPIPTTPKAIFGLTTPTTLKATHTKYVERPTTGTSSTTATPGGVGSYFTGILGSGGPECGGIQKVLGLCSASNNPK